MWEQDIGKRINEEEWRKIWKMRVLRFMSVRIREKNFKFSLRLYLTLLKLNKVNANHPNVCWKCEKQIGMYFHMWLECEKMQRFWKQNFKELSYICGKDIEFNAEIALLSIYENVEYDKKTKELVTNLLTAARLIIARCHIQH